MKELFERVFTRLSSAERIVFMGIGEEKMTDDGIGPYIITELLDKSNSQFLFINAGIDPLARIEEIFQFNPSHLIIIDTCTLNASPGTVGIIERKDMIDLVPISSHTLPIHIVIDYILEKINNLDVFMLGIVPESLAGFSELNQYKEGELTLEDLNHNLDLPFFEFQLTETLQNTADILIKFIKDIMKKLS